MASLNFERSRNGVRAALIFAILGLLGAAIALAFWTASLPKTDLRDVESTVINATTVFPVLSQLKHDQISTNFAEMIRLAHVVALVPVADVPPEYVTDPEGRKAIVTNRTGTGGWLYDPIARSLTLNLTNSLKVRSGWQTVDLPPDFFVVSNGLVFISFPSTAGVEYGPYLDALRKKAELFISHIMPTNTPARERATSGTSGSQNPQSP